MCFFFDLVRQAGPRQIGTPSTMSALQPCSEQALSPFDSAQGRLCRRGTRLNFDIGRSLFDIRHSSALRLPFTFCLFTLPFSLLFSVSFVLCSAIAIRSTLYAISYVLYHNTERCFVGDILVGIFVNPVNPVNPVWKALQTPSSEDRSLSQISRNSRLFPGFLLHLTRKESYSTYPYGRNRRKIGCQGPGFGYTLWR